MLLDIDRWLEPFWQSDIILEESVMMFPNAQGVPEASLLFPPRQILAVKSARMDAVYIEGIDWRWSDGRLQLLPGSRAPYVTSKQLYPISEDGGTGQFWHEGHWFHDRQLAVTYSHASGVWRGPVPVVEETRLKRTLAKLRSGSPLKIVLYGDSIAEGYNASGFASQETPAPPYMPGWGELFARRIGKHYRSRIAFRNAALAGKDTRWGVEHARALVAAEEPDLVIVAFGMNDGSAKLAPDAFIANIRAIMVEVKARNPAAEFILVSPMLPNPVSSAAGIQEAYAEPLRQLGLEGRAAFVDMTGVHRELLAHKHYRDMTGNHINHPNDYLIRWYAQQISSTLIPSRGD